MWALFLNGGIFSSPADSLPQRGLLCPFGRCLFCARCIFFWPLPFLPLPLIFSLILPLPILGYWSILSIALLLAVAIKLPVSFFLVFYMVTNISTAAALFTGWLTSVPLCPIKKEVSFFKSQLFFFLGNVG
jgi:hypothetical protein